MPVYASVADVQVRWIDPVLDLTDAGDQQRVQALLDEAHDELSLKVSDVETRITEGKTTPGRVKRVLVAAVIRVLDNPRGYLGERAGETGFYFGAGSNVRDGQIQFTREELTRLGVPRSIGGSTIATGLPGYRGGLDD